MEPILEAMRRYVAFVNTHDFELCREVMTAGYTVHYGSREAVGLEDGYIPACQEQLFDRFPDFSFTVHELLTDGTHVGVLFSEHGRTAAGQPAAFAGAGVFRWNGERLAECWVEVDGYSRDLQIAEGRPASELVLPVAMAPYSGHDCAPDADAVEVVRSWLAGMTAWPPAGVEADAGPHAAERAALTGVAKVTPNAIVGAQGRVVFHATLGGRYAGKLRGLDSARGRDVRLHVAGLATVRDGSVSSGHAWANRVELRAQLDQ